LRSGLYTEPHWGAYSTPPEPVAVGEEAICPSPRIPPLLSAVGLEFLHFGPQDSPAKTWVTSAIKIAAKGSTSLKRLKNTDLVSIPVVLLLQWLQCHQVVVVVY